jgi:hypothetical protein
MLHVMNNDPLSLSLLVHPAPSDEIICYFGEDECFESTPSIKVLYGGKNTNEEH